MQPDPFESEADAMADAALTELGEIPLDQPDEYADLCEYAGCYPWLGETAFLQRHSEAFSAVSFSDEIDPFVR